MKLVINYDMIEAIKNVNQPFGPFKVIRNRKKVYTALDLPIFAGFCIVSPDNAANFATTYAWVIGLDIMTQSIPYMIYKFDLYKEKASIDLKRLVSQLGNLNISTDYELLLKSEMYQKNYKLEKQNKFYRVVQNKYIYLPTYNSFNDVKDSSILQEHVVGSSEYVLSIGSPKKAFQPAYVNI